MSLNTLFCNLKVISQLKEGQKLYVSDDDEIVIGDNSYSEGLLRWWYSETRENTLDRIRSISKEAVHVGNNAIRSELGSEKNTDFWLENSETSLKLREWETERDKVKSVGNKEFLEILVVDMSGMIQGINILKKTYEDDVTFCSKLELVIQNLNTNIDKFKKFLTNAV